MKESYTSMDELQLEVVGHRRTEKALRESEKKFAAAFKNSPVSMTITDEVGTYVDVNDVFLRSTGYARDEIIGFNLVETPIFADNNEFRQMVSLMLKQGYVYGMEMIYRMKNGDIRNGLLSSSAIRLSGRPHVISNIVDITERKQAVESLRQAEEKYRNIVENALEGIFQSTPDGRFISANRSNAIMLGYDSPEELMKDVTDIARQLYVNPEDRAKLRKTLETQDVVKGFETQFYRKDGKLIWLSINMRAIRDPAGRLLHYEGFSADITDSRESFERLRKALGATVQAMAMTVETRDPYTAGHQRRVADLARAIATEMGFTPHQIDGIRMASTIHDIGKISVPAEILSKPSRLTELEFALIKAHPVVGFDILKDIDFPWPIAKMVLEHHERTDGSGYPYGLKRDEILPESRIIIVADVVEAMASHRPYRPAFGIEATLAEIMKNKGILYEAAVVDACVTLFRGKGYKFE